jgi:hypothetical protein
MIIELPLSSIFGVLNICEIHIVELHAIILVLVITVRYIIFNIKWIILVALYKLTLYCIII